MLRHRVFYVRAAAEWKDAACSDCLSVCRAVWHKAVLDSRKGEGLMNYYYMAMRGSLVVGLNTDLDHHLADEVRQVIDEVVEERGIRSIIFDFSKVTFMDSSGIGLIMGRYKKMHQNGRIAIVAPCRSVERILQISGLHKLVTVFESMGEALDSCEIHDDNIAAEKGGKRSVKY